MWELMEKVFFSVYIIIESVDLVHKISEMNWTDSFLEFSSLFVFSWLF